jgi:hypothetical protein
MAGYLKYGGKGRYALEGGVLLMFRGGGLE